MLKRFTQPEQWRHLGGAVPPLPAGDYRRDQAGEHAAWVGPDGRLRARCSLWWSDEWMVDGSRAGAIGHFAAADRESGAKLLDAACAILKRAGCDVAVGPMDGSTWRSYRLIVERGDEPPFFLEPDSADDGPAAFTAAGFRMCAAYRSALCDDLTLRDMRLGRVERRLAQHGVRLRPLAIERLEEELRSIHAVSLEAFRGAFLYQPIPLESLARHLEPVLAAVDPALVLLAERERELLGFAFAVPDLRRAARGEAVDTAIVKTLAVRPGRLQGGLGGVLLERCHDAARQRGMRRVIHALMHEGNRPVLRLSSRYARTIRRYGLYARELR